MKILTCIIGEVYIYDYRYDIFELSTACLHRETDGWRLWIGNSFINKKTFCLTNECSIPDTNKETSFTSIKEAEQWLTRNKFKLTRTSALHYFNKDELEKKLKSLKKLKIQKEK